MFPMSCSAAIRRGRVLRREDGERPLVTPAKTDVLLIKISTLVDIVEGKRSMCGDHYGLKLYHVDLISSLNAQDITAMFNYSETCPGGSSFSQSSVST